MALAVIRRGDRWALGTTGPGAEMLGIHNRQPATIAARDWRRWLTAEDWPADLTVAPPAGVLRALQVREALDPNGQLSLGLG